LSFAEAKRKLEACGFKFEVEGCLGIYGQHPSGTDILLRWKFAEDVVPQVEVLG
jgi:hypothetical protein